MEETVRMLLPKYRHLVKREVSDESIKTMLRDAILTERLRVADDRPTSQTETPIPHQDAHPASTTD